MTEHKQENRDINTLKRWDQNPKKASKKDIARLKKQIEKYGIYKPLIIIDDGTVIGGNQRLVALKELGAKTAWVSIVNPKSEAEKIEIALSDNDRVGFYDQDMLSELVAPFKDIIEFKNFSIDFREPILLKNTIDNYSPLTEKDNIIPEAPEKTDVKRGDIFQLGDHRLMCGSALVFEDVKKLMNSAKIDFVFNDPPYRLKSKSFGARKNRQYGDLDSSIVFEYDEWLNHIDILSAENMRILVWECWSNTKDLWIALEKYWKVRGLIIWHATNRTNSFKNPNTGLFNKYDICIHASKGNKKVTKNVPFRPVDLISETVERTSRSGQDKVFGAKPVEILLPYISLYTNIADNIVDLFAGAGSTMIACEKLNRKSFSMEIHPIFVEVCIQRWEKFTGKKASKI